MNAEKPIEPATVTVTINGDTLGKISKYVFGNAIAAWAGAHDNPTFVEGAKFLAPTLIRFPGGSWSDGYFWNGCHPMFRIQFMTEQHIIVQPELQKKANFGDKRERRWQNYT